MNNECLLDLKNTPDLINSKIFFRIIRSSLKSKDKIFLYDLLKKRNFNFNVLDKNRNNVFFYIQDKPSLWYFYNEGVSLNIKNKEGVPMSLFLNNKDLEFLIENNKFPELLNNQKGINYLFKDKGKLYFKYIDKIENKNFLNSFGENIAFYTPSNEELFKKLINNNVDLLLKNKNNENILYKASVKKIKMLIDLKINIEIDQDLIKKVINNICHYINNSPYFIQNQMNKATKIELNKLYILLDYFYENMKSNNLYLFSLLLFKENKYLSKHPHFITDIEIEIEKKYLFSNKYSENEKEIITKRI